MALPRRAKQKGIQLMNYGKKRHEKLLSQDIPKDCVICLDKVECRGSIICEHWFCFECIHEWSKKTNTCPLCKQRFRCITKVSIGSKNCVPQKIRVKDKNQSNISIAEDDYEVAMGLVDESSDNSVEDSNDLDETFQPNSRIARNNLTPPYTSRPSVRRSTREASQQVMERYATNNTEETLRQSETSDISRPSVRRSTREASQQVMERFETRQSSRRLHSNDAASAEDTNSFNISTATTSQENTYDDNDLEMEEASSEQMDTNSLQTNSTEEIAEASGAEQESEESEEEEEEKPVKLSKRRKKRKSIVYKSPKRKKQRSTNQWIDMSSKKTTDDSYYDRLRCRRNRPSHSRSPPSRSVKEKAMERMREQHRFLNASITTLLRDQYNSSEHTSTKSPKQEEEIEELSQVNVRKSKRSGVVISSSEDEDFDVINHERVKNNEDSMEEKSVDEPCCSRSLRKDDNKQSSVNFEIRFVDSDSDADEVEKDNNQFDVDCVSKRKDDSRIPVEVEPVEKTKKKYTFRKTTAETVIQNDNTAVKSTSTGPVVQPSLQKPHSVTREKQSHRPSTSSFTRTRKSGILVSSPICSDSDDETCFLSCHDTVLDPRITPGARKSRDKSTINISDINISVNSCLGDDIISPCVLSQISQRNEVLNNSSAIMTTPKKKDSRSSREIETTPVNSKFESNDNPNSEIIGSPDLFENMDSVRSSRNRPIKTYTFKKFRRNFRHYSPSQKPLTNIVNIQ